MRRKISWDGPADRSKTVYSPPPPGSGGIKNRHNYSSGNTFLGLEQKQKCGEIKQINGSASGANQI
jgi:hypothetical protein